MIPYGIPFGYRPAHTTPPHIGEVPLHVFKAAKRVNATHLSADGKTAYDRRGNDVRQSFWDDELRGFGCWWPCGELPADVVELP